MDSTPKVNRVKDDDESQDDHVDDGAFGFELEQIGPRRSIKQIKIGNHEKSDQYGYPTKQSDETIPNYHEDMIHLLALVVDKLTAYNFPDVNFLFRRQVFPRPRSDPC